MSKQDAVPDPSGRAGRGGLQRRLLVALLFALPSIGSWLSTNIVYLRLDELQQPVKAEIARLKMDISDLERFVTQFQGNELSRATLNLLMSAVSAEMQLRYLGDNLYRASSMSIGSLRRAAAIIYPDRWQATLKPYEETIAQGYDSPSVIQKLQEFENKVIADALSMISRDQERINALTEVHDEYERKRRFIAGSLTYLAIALSIFLFAFKLYTAGS